MWASGRADVWASGCLVARAHYFLTGAIQARACARAESTATRRARNASASATARVDVSALIEAVIPCGAANPCVAEAVRSVDKPISANSCNSRSTSKTRGRVACHSDAASAAVALDRICGISESSNHESSDLVWARRLSHALRTDRWE